MIRISCGTLLAGSFSGNPDYLIDQCTKEIDREQHFIVNNIFGIIRANNRSLEITKETIFDQYYGSKSIHLLFNLWYKDFNYTPAFQNNNPQMDHIFPQSLLKNVKDQNPNTGHWNILRYKWWERDQIANLMLLTQTENGAGGKRDIPPEQWFEGKTEEYLNMHLIPHDKELWKLDNYPAFIEARKALIADKFKSLVLSVEEE